MSSQYLLILPLEKVTLHNDYAPDTELPLHCTLMPWFSLSPQLTLNALTREIVDATYALRGIELISKKSVLLGPKNDKPAHILELNDHLILLHKLTLAFLVKKESLPKESGLVGNGYRPHVTDTQRKQFLPGTSCVVSKIALVELNEGGHMLISRFIQIGR